MVQETPQLNTNLCYLTSPEVIKHDTFIFLAHTLYIKEKKIGTIRNVMALCASKDNPHIYS